MIGAPIVYNPNGGGGGGGGNWTPYPYDIEAGNPIVITHGLGQIPVNVIIMDEDKNLVDPLYQLQFTDPNTVTINLNNPLTGIVFISP